MRKRLTPEEMLTEEINMSEFILHENGDQEWTIDNDWPYEAQIATAKLNALNSIGRSLITLNRLILQGYTRS